MKKENNFGYKFLRNVLGPVWNFYYNAKVVGQENIPEDGSIVVVGNHIHIMDQCPAILSTKRMLHYMAKKEYFDGKFAWFFKACGCIPVNRSIHDDSAKSAAMDVLNSNYALGLFPEGTRNGLKPEKMKEVGEFCGLEFDKRQMKILKNQRTSQINFLMELVNDERITMEEFKDNLFRCNDFMLELVDKKIISMDTYYDKLFLPFKFGAVSMASKSDSYIVPFVITGTYKFRSKDLRARFGKAFKPGDDLEKANNKLRKVMIDLYKENIKNSGK